MPSFLKKGGLAVLTVLFSAVVTSSIVPGIIAELDYRRTLRETRLRIAHEINTQGILVETQINNLETIVGIFQKDAARMTPAEAAVAQAAARQRMASVYRGYERVAWWWFRRIQRDAALTRRDGQPVDTATREAQSAEKKRLDDAVEKYTAALNETATAIDTLWTRVLREPPEAARAATPSRIVKETTAQLRAIGQRRRDSLTEMTRIFEDPEPAPWFYFWSRS